MNKLINIALIAFAFLGLITSAKANPSAQSYIEKFTTLDRNLAQAWKPLWNDVTYAYNPYTPPEREINRKMNLMEMVGGLDFETSQAWFRERDQARQKFLNSPAGKSWVSKRATARKALNKNFPQRVAALRRLNLRLRSISPVPNSLREADHYVTEYSLNFDGLINLMKKAVSTSSTDVYGLEEQAQAASRNYNAAVNEMARYKAIPRNKVYIEG